MNSLKTKTILTWKRANQALAFFGLTKKRKLNQAEIDRKLVYGLSPRKIPHGKQLKHLNKFLNPKEYLIIKICLLLIIINAAYLGIAFFKKHLQYTPVSGGEYIEGIVGYPKTINPLYSVNRDVDSDLNSLVYSSLFKYDQNGLLISDLAESVVINEDKEYVIKIKSGAHWQNGDTLSADDVLFTIDAIKNAEYRSPLRSSLSSVEAEKVDDLTIKLTLSAPYSPFLEVLTFGILPKSIWENVSPSSAASSDLNLKPIGSGPYKFKSFVKNKDGDLKEYNLVVNDDYYSRKPYIKNIKFKFFVDYTEAIKSLNDNQIDGLGYLPFEERKELLAKDSLSLNELIRPQIFSLFFNSNKDKALSDKVVRVSLAQAIDKDQMINEVFGGVYQRADGPILSNNFAYNDQITKYNFSPLEATANIKNKLASTTLTVIDSGTNVIVAEKIKAYWEKIGVVVVLKIVPGEQATDTIKNRDFEILLYGESVGGDPDVFAFWHSSQISAKGLNLAGYNNPDVDKLLSDARATTNIEDRKIKYQKFQEILVNDVPAIFLYSPTYTYVQSKKLKGFDSTMIIEPAVRFAGVADWYLKTSKKLTW
ncbi:MAG: peptide ABC transporter substrate-binding protein [Candidatus Falkowbacteria bacterium]